MATSLTFATLFFAGAAFSAGAGDVVVGALEGETTTEEVASEAVAEEEEPAAAEEQPAEAPAVESEQPAEGEAPAGGGDTQAPPADEAPQDESADDEAPSEPEAPAGPDDEQGADGDGGSSSGGGGGGQSSGGGESDSPPPAPSLDEGSDPTPAPAEAPPVASDLESGPNSLDPEADVANVFATVWLHRVMPDPTPPASRLTPLFAKTLVRESTRAKVDWAVVLGSLRASGFNAGTTSTSRVRRTAEALSANGARRDAWRAFLAFRGRTTFADRALALTRYNRAVGLDSLVRGLVAAKPTLQNKVLRDPRLSIYPAGRLDVAMGRIDVRVLVLLEYLAESHGSVTVSSLFSGHRLYSRPGVVSAHVYGLAVDVAALGGSPIAGNQDASGLTAKAVRNILLLPAELQPRQVISLLGLGGPSFPLADHWDHIHVGY